MTYSDNKETSNLANKKKEILTKINLINEAVANKKVQEIFELFPKENDNEISGMSDSAVKMIENLQDSVI